MSDASYHDETETLSCSQFKIYCESPVEYYETFVTKRMKKREATNAMKLGTIEHALCLEKKAIDDICRAYPTTCLKANGHLNPKPARAFAEKIWPLIAATDQQIEQALMIQENVMKSELGDILRLDAQFEKRVESVVNGVPVRCKPDIHSVIGESGTIWDLKCTARIRPDDWWRTASQLKYFLQDAWYTLGAQAKYDVPFQFRFWAIENKFPYRVAPYWYDDRSREIAQEYVRNKLDEFKQRQATGDWSDNWENSGSVTPWQLGANDDGEIVAYEGDSSE